MSKNTSSSLYVQSGVAAFLIQQKKWSKERKKKRKKQNRTRRNTKNTDEHKKVKKPHSGLGKEGGYGASKGQHCLPEGDRERWKR